LRNDGFQVYDCIDADLRPFANDGEVEYPCACGQEDLVFDGAAEERGVGADEYCIANLNRVLSGGADYRVVAHDDLLTERDGLTLGNEARTVSDDTTGSDPHVANKCRVRCDDRRGVNARAMAPALQQHRNTTSTFRVPQRVLGTPLALPEAVVALFLAGVSEAAAVQEVNLPQYANLQRYKEWMPLNVRAAYRYLRAT